MESVIGKQAQGVVHRKLPVLVIKKEARLFEVREDGQILGSHFVLPLGLGLGRTNPMPRGGAEIKVNTMGNLTLLSISLASFAVAAGVLRAWPNFRRRAS
ncbi:hypothetical protein [Solidesulfovibrio sp.]